LNVLSTAVLSVYTTNSPQSNILAGTAIWSPVATLAGITNTGASIATAATVTGPITGISYTITTPLAGNQATISINAGFAPK